MSWRENTNQLSTAIDGLGAVDQASMSGVEQAAFIEELHRQWRRLDLARHETIGTFETSGRLLDAGFRTISQFQVDRLHVSKWHAGRTAALARSLAHMPTVVKHWAEGNLDAEAARALAELRDDLTAELFDRDEAWLADAAAHCDRHDLQRVCREWRLRVDPDGTDPAERDKDAHVSTSFQGSVRADANLDPVGGAIVKTTFDGIVDELFRADWAEAKQRLGRDPKMSELRRTKAERRHDAFVEMAARARNHNSGARSRPLVTVVAGLPALAEGLARLWNDIPLSPDQLADLLAQDPDIQRFVYGSDEQPIRYNPKHRLFTGKLREAILTRDRRCTGLGCDQDTRRGAVDHIHPYGQGGATTPDNGRGTCHPCNRSRPKRRFRNDHDDRGDPPGGADPP